MEGYASEQEQIESIKRWWHANGKSVVLGIIIGVAVLIGGRWWVGQQNTQAEQAADQYQQVLADMQRGETAAAIDRGARLLEEQKTSPYAALTALVLAKIKINEQDRDGARHFLQWTVDNAADASMKDVARLRLARVLLADGDGAAALSLAQAVDATAFALPLQELKGDALVNLERLDEARGAYRAALEAAQQGSVESDRLQMKLTALGGADAS